MRCNWKLSAYTNVQHLYCKISANMLHGIYAWANLTYTPHSLQRASVSKQTPTRVQETHTHARIRTKHQNGVYSRSIIDVWSLGRVRAFPQGSCAAAEVSLSIPRLKDINTLKCLAKSLNKCCVNNNTAANSYKTQFCHVNKEANE